MTNRLIDAAKRSSEGDIVAGAALVESLRQQHHAALGVLVSEDSARAAVEHKLEEILAEGKRPVAHIMHKAIYRLRASS